MAMANHACTRIVLATHNAGKTTEFARLLGDEFRVERLPADVALPEETGSTFLENAEMKAESAFVALGEDVAVLADDSGLIAEALGDRPGVHSARFAGPGADDAANMARLLAELEGKANRRGRFVCVLALRLPARGDRPAETLVAQGRLEGVLTQQPRGHGGFGYDPLFVPEGWSRTLAEVSGEEKDAVSHRARAVEALRRRLQEGTSEA